jgi:hypothetical protein
MTMPPTKGTFQMANVTIMLKTMDVIKGNTSFFWRSLTAVPGQSQVSDQ